MPPSDVPAGASTMRAVRFDRYGHRDELRVDELPLAAPGAGEVLVEVRAAGCNPGEVAIREGELDAFAPSTFPSGQGSDLAGVVAAVGEGVTAWAPGDEVLGWCWTRASQASHVVVPADSLVRKPEGLGWEQAGGLYVVGVTAYAAVRAVDPQPGEVVAVSAAAGGVGSLVVQLLVARGVRVLGIASASRRDWLEAHGAELVPYGDDLEDRLRAAAPDGVDAFIDLFGPEYVHLAVALGVAPERIETIIAFQAADEVGAKAEGSTDATSTEVLGEVAGLVARGELELDIAAIFPLEEVQDAFALLEEGHVHGKVVLLP